MLAFREFSFYQNRFINECARKNFSLILVITYLRNYGKTEFFCEMYVEELTLLKKHKTQEKGLARKDMAFLINYTYYYT